MEGPPQGDGHEELGSRREDSMAGRGEDDETLAFKPPQQMCPKDKGHHRKEEKRNTGTVAIQKGEACWNERRKRIGTQQRH